jgi:hypothetical protein
MESRRKAEASAGISGTEPRAEAGRFASGVVVLVTLNSPREKFWGAILDISPAGLSVRGLDLNSFDDFVGLVRSGEPVSLGAVFFPMHRVERVEIDARNGDIPSLQERFHSKSEREFTQLVGTAPATGIEVGCTLAEAQRRLVAATVESVGRDLARAAALLDLPEDELRSWLRR